MNARLQRALTVEHSLTHDLPLQTELERLPGGRVRQASLAARDGHLPLALTLLRIDPLVAACQHIDPHAARAVGERLRRVPGMWPLLSTVATPAVYIGAVLVIELIVSTLLSQKVVPVLEMDLGSQIVTGRAYLAGGAVAAVVLLLWAIALLAFQIRFDGKAFLRLFDGVRAARLFASAEALDRLGIPPSRSIPLLLDAARVPADRLETLAGPGTPDGATCAELSRLFSERSRRSAQLTASAVKIGGGVLTALIAFSQVATIYLALSRLSAGVLR